MKYDENAYKAKFAEAKTRWPTLNKKQLHNLTLVWLAVEQLTPTLEAGDTLSVDVVRNHMSDPEAGTGPSTTTVSKYLRKLEEFEAQAPRQSEDAGPGPAAADTLELSPPASTAFNALNQACTNVAVAFKGVLNTAVASESERSRVALAALRYQHEISRHQYAAEIDAVKRDRQKIEIEAEGFEAEAEELRLTASASNAACEAATVKAGCLEHELEVAKVELNNARQQVADSGNQLGDVRDALRVALQRVEKTEGESQHHQRVLNEAVQQHAAEIAEVRASCAADVERERERNSVLELAIIRALGAGAPGDTVNNNQEDAR